MHCREPLSQKAELETRIRFARKLADLKEFDDLLTVAKIRAASRLAPIFPPLEVPRRCR